MRANKKVRKRPSRREQVAKRPLAAVILAAGEGKRMRSRTAKVLHRLAGRTLVEHVLDAVDALAPDIKVVVTGHQEDAVRAAIADRAVFAPQAEQLGTGHAVLQAKPALRGLRGDVLVLCGDVPLLTPATLKKLRAVHRRRAALATVLAMHADDPTGYGRVIDDEVSGLRIVEHADASDAERSVDVVNSGTYCFDSAFLFSALAGLNRDNAQGEYYLTDVIGAAAAKSSAASFVLPDESECLGVNSRSDLALAEALLRERLVSYWMERGVTFIDPDAVYIGAEVRIGPDTIIGPNVRLEGATRIGAGCTVEGTCFLNDAVIADDVVIRWGVVANEVTIKRGAKVGPYAHLRPEAELGEDVHIGNFVEVKKSRIGRGSKANHLTYIGDATVGRDTNIGAGTITCNYDGFDKHRTTIGDRVQIGSDTQLVAPVELGSDSYVAAGSTVTRDVEAGSLVFNDKRQKSRSGWVAAFRKAAAKRRKTR